MAIDNMLFAVHLIYRQGRGQSKSIANVLRERSLYGIQRFDPKFLLICAAVVVLKKYVITNNEEKYEKHK